MALRWMDGFDFYNTTGYINALVARNYSYSTTDGGAFLGSGRFSGKSLSLDGTPKGNISLSKTISASGVSGWYVGFNARFISTSASFFYAFGVSPFGQIGKGIVLQKSNSGVSRINGASITTPFTLNQWYHFEAYFPNGAGTAELWIDGVSVGTTTNTLNYSTSWMLWGDQGGVSCEVDDLYILDDTGSTMNGRLGASYIPRIETLLPTSDVTSNFSNTGAGTGYGCVGVTPYSSSRYISSSAQNNQSTFGKSSLSTITNPLVVGATSISASATAGTTTYQHLLCNTDGCSVIASPKTASVYSDSTPYANDFLETNTLLSEVWGVNSVNNLKFGLANQTVGGSPVLRNYHTLLQVLGTNQSVTDNSRTTSGGVILSQNLRKYITSSISRDISNYINR